jgi:hypothetical protein
MLVEMFLSSTVPVVDDESNPTKILGWNIVYTGQNLTTLEEYSKTGTILLATPLPYGNIDRTVLEGIVNNYVEEQNWDEEILEHLNG